MSDLPKRVDMHEEGTREGFQVEPGPMTTAQSIVGHALPNELLHAGSLDAFPRRAA